MCWTSERKTDLAAFALLMGKLPSQVAANLGDVYGQHAVTLPPQSTRTSESCSRSSELRFSVTQVLQGVTGAEDLIL